MKKSKKTDNLQPTLLKYLGMVEKQEEVYSDISIYLDWNGSNNFKVSYHTGILDKREYYLDMIRLGHNTNRNLHIYGKFSNDNNIKLVQFVDKPKYLYNKAILKSNIQKAVRLGDVSSAIIASLSLIKIDLLSFLRRIIIVAIEDSAIPDTLDFIVWLMVAFPNYQINNEIIRVLLNTVYSIANYKNQLTLNSKPYIHGFSYDVNTISDMDLVKIPYLASIAIRRAYGGMFFDRVLMDIWINGLVNNSNYNYVHVDTGRPLVIIKNIETIDIIQSSIDHHCLPSILDYIYNRLDRKDNISMEMIKSCIWDYSSSLNIRRPPKPYNIEKELIWLKIRDILYKLQKNYIKNLEKQIR